MHIRLNATALAILMLSPTAFGGPAGDARRLAKEAVARIAAASKSCTQPRFADACAKSITTAQLDDGSLAVLNQHGNIEVLRPKFSSKKDIELRIPNDDGAPQMGDGRLTKVGEGAQERISYAKGGMAYGESGVQATWTPEGELLSAQAYVRENNSTLAYSIDRRVNRDGEVTFEAEVLNSERLKEGLRLKQSFKLHPDEYITTVKKVDRETGTMNVAVRNRKTGEMSDRDLNLRAPQATATNTRPEFPDAGAVQ